MGRTRLEKQLQAYGQFQNEIRKMSKEDRERYAPPGTPEHDRYIARRDAADKRRAQRDREIKKFNETRPQYSITRDLSEEGLARLLQLDKDWQTAREKFMRDLNTRLPLLDV